MKVTEFLCVPVCICVASDCQLRRNGRTKKRGGTRTDRKTNHFTPPKETASKYTFEVLKKGRGLEIGSSPVLFGRPCQVRGKPFWGDKGQRTRDNDPSNTFGCIQGDPQNQPPQTSWHIAHFFLSSSFV